MPHQLSDDTEEERRVFHVAITRGRRSVTILADAARPTRFLDEIDGTAPHTVDPAPVRADRKAARPPSDALFVAVGDEVTMAGGFKGRVDEILVTGILIKLSETGATMAVPWGEKVKKGEVSGRVTPGLDGPADTDLVDRLKTWRLEQARSQGVPAYVVFTDKTLEAIAAIKPSTESALLDVPGIGPAKLDAYGDQLLDLLAGD
jgi:hypothetical protein